MMVSKISMKLAILMFFCAVLIWGPLGISIVAMFVPVILIVLFMSFVFSPFFLVLTLYLFPIFIIFNVIWTVIYYSDAVEDTTAEESYQKAKKYAKHTVISTNIICIGLLFFKQAELGIIIYTFATYLLLFAVFTKNINSKKHILYANCGLILLLVVFFGSMVFLYYYSLDEYQHRDDSNKHFDLTYRFFRGKDSDLKIPDLIRVMQNDKDSKRNQYYSFQRDELDYLLDNNNGWGHSTPKDLTVLPEWKDDLIEVDSGQMRVLGHSKCEMNSNEHADIFLPAMYLKDGYLWVQYFQYSDMKVARPSNLEGDYIYRAKNLDQRHTQIQLIRKKDQQILYEQTLVTYKKDGLVCQYGPQDYSRELASFMKKPYFEKNYDLLAQSQQIMNKNEKIDQQCNEQMIKENLYKFGQNLIDVGRIGAQTQFLCSDHYVAWLYKDHHYIWYKNEPWNGKMRLFIFNRENLNPVKCGDLSYNFSQMHTKDIESGKVKVEHLNIIDKDYSEYCPIIALTMSDGEMYEESGLGKRYD